MADESEDESQKTEEPTQRKIEEALKQGQMIYSRELTHFLVILALTLVITMVVASLFKQTTLLLRGFIEHAGQVVMDEKNTGFLLSDVVKKSLLHLLIPLGAFMVAGIISSVLQHGGLKINPDLLMPKWDRVSPVKGLGRLFSMRSLVEFFKGIIKLIVIGIILYAVLYGKLQPLKIIYSFDLIDMLRYLLTLLVRVLIGVCIFLGLLSIADYLYQRHEFYKNLRMSKQDLKEEYKQTEGHPEVKSKQRSLRLERARKRMMSAVPKADVIITNPTHYSIALQYDIEKMKAPMVIAKGQDLIALKIREIGKKHNIVIHEQPLLARALYSSVEIGDYIPETHYHAVAQIISYVFQKQGKRVADNNKK
jgi:flagellar biosynthetic protein FlhB